ncbi:MAG TPA: hypothetical protein VEL07_19320 [Planctomycetota bacterium]|nr:hypothetical protein [Planctomycetota bacterium]
MITWLRRLIALPFIVLGVAAMVACYVIAFLITAILGQADFARCCRAFHQFTKQD